VHGDGGRPGRQLAGLDLAVGRDGVVDHHAGLEVDRLAKGVVARERCARARDALPIECLAHGLHHAAHGQ
jgi:hypothetical protein